MQSDGLALMYAGKNMGNDREIVLAAAQQNRASLHFASAALRFDLGFLAQIDNLQVPSQPQNISSENSFLTDRDGSLFADTRELFEMAKEGLEVFSKNSESIFQHFRNIWLASRMGVKAAVWAPFVNALDQGAVVRLIEETPYTESAFALLPVTQPRIAIAWLKTGRPFKDLYHALYSERNVMLAAVQKDGRTLKFASKVLRADFDVVKAAVDNDPLALMFASDNLRRNKTLLLAALTKNIKSLAFADSAVLNDLSFILEAVKINFQSFKHVSRALSCDPRTVFLAATANPQILQFASYDLRRNRDFIFSLINTNVWTLPRVHVERRFEATSNFAAIGKIARLLEVISPDLLEKKEIFLEALKGNKHIFQLASPEFLNNSPCVLHAMKIGKIVLQLINEQFWPDSSVAKEAMELHASTLQFASEELRQDRAFVLNAVKINQQSLQFAHDDLRRDCDFVLKIVHENVLNALPNPGIAFQFAHDDLRRNREKVQIAVMKYENILEFVHDDLRKDPRDRISCRAKFL